ncbi:MAG: glycoside hydrolase family 64 protein [Clostridiales bacterium]
MKKRFSIIIGLIIGLIVLLITVFVFVLSIYSFPYNKDNPAFGTEEYNYIVGNTDYSDSNDSDLNDNSNLVDNSIYSVMHNLIPNTDDGKMVMKILNGTNGKYTDDKIYWGILGINPVDKKWSYLDLEGNLHPISLDLNDQDKHLIKNGINYANIYHTIADSKWVTLPKMDSGRIFISYNSPCYIKTYDDGFAGPNIDNETDPNKEVYFDFVEFTINDSGYHGNTTRVDGFGFPIQHRLLDNSGNYDKTVGELESESRDEIFNKYQSEVPNEFKDLGTIQAPYRIVAPIHGSFNDGGQNENYFSSYTNISTRDILLGTGEASDPNLCAQLNRHVYGNDDEKVNNSSEYYKSAPANFYAKFWHDHSIDTLAYGFCYDDVNQQAAYLEVGKPKALIIRAGW